MEKKDGGLGIRNLSRLNRALLGKWHCRFASEQDSMETSDCREIWRGKGRLLF